MAEPFRRGITRDFIRPNGELGFGGAGVWRLGLAGVDLLRASDGPD